MTDRDRGYTLIELSVVVLLIGIVLLLAVPRVRDTLLNDAMKAATRQLVGAAHALRNESVREQLDYVLHLDLDRPAFWTSSADMTAEKRDELRQKASPFPTGIRIADVRQSDGAKKTDGEAVIRFSRRGYLEPTVVHLSQGDKVLTLVFNPFLPAVTVYEKYVDFTLSGEGLAAGL